MNQGYEGEGREHGLPAVWWNTESVLAEAALHQLEVGSHPPSTIPNLCRQELHQAPNLDHQEDPGQQATEFSERKVPIHSASRKSGPMAKSLHFWLLASWAQCLLGSCSGKCDQYSLCHRYWSDMAMAGLWRKVSPCKTVSSPPFTQEWGKPSRIWEKHKNLYCNNKTRKKHTKDTLQTLFLPLISTPGCLPVFWDSKM